MRKTVDGGFGLTIAAGNGTVGFNSTVGNGTALTSLSSTGTGAVTFSGAVGTNLLRLGSVSITGATNINGGSVYTSGIQSYNGAVSLGADTTAGRPLAIMYSFSSTVDGAHALTVAAGTGHSWF